MDIIDFYQYIHRLKNTKRTGWVVLKIPEPESVGDHSFAMTLLAMIFAKQMNLDQLKVMKMAIIHDIGESITGDIVTEHGKVVDEKLLEEKKVIELDAIKSIFSDNKEAIALFNEFEEDKTPEAKLVKQLDKLEVILQAHAYENDYGVNLEEFYESGFMKIKDPQLRKILDELYSSRPKSITKPNSK